MKKRLWWLILAGCLVIAAITVAIILVTPKPLVPVAIKKQLTSTLLLPMGSDAVIDRSSIKYDAPSKLLTYTLSYAGANMVVSEQPTPETFVDIPQAYQKVIDGLNSYTTFEVNVGTVFLTKPKQLAGKQAAVLNTKGTLLFAKSDANLTNDQWRTFFTHMTVITD